MLLCPFYSEAPNKLLKNFGGGDHHLSSNQGVTRHFYFGAIHKPRRGAFTNHVDMAEESTVLQKYEKAALKADFYDMELC